MKALVFGYSGQVASELRKRGPEHGIQVQALGRDAADLTDPEACAAIVQKTDAQVVINAAAYTAVDKAEAETELAHLINAEAPAAMARVAARRGLPFLHISTDYVFDGSGSKPFEVTDQTAPLNVYGHSKLEGEVQVAKAGGWHAIFRTSWVFSAHGNNFVKTILRLAETRDQLNIVADQVGGPTSATDIADCLLCVAKAGPKGNGGIFHFSGAPEISWAGFAREISSQAHLSLRIDDIPTQDYPTPAARPLNSRLDCTRLETEYGIARPDWRQALAEVLSELDRTKTTRSR